MNFTIILNSLDFCVNALSLNEKQLQTCESFDFSSLKSSYINYFYSVQNQINQGI